MTRRAFGVRGHRASGLVLGLVMALYIALPAGCVDVRTFSGSWSGPIVDEAAIRQGFAGDVQVDPLVLANVTLDGLSATLTTSDDKFHATRLVPVTRAGNDVLASLSFDGDPLRSYLLFAPVSHTADTKSSSRDTPVVASDTTALVLVSLFSDDHVELRILERNSLYGVFRLQRSKRASSDSGSVSDGGSASSD